ncbi:SDR family oxidoreductase [Microvirga thermotolerans]|uniref:SDR family NAD(P)-dependent oxidoreductase n=1 Tax=Microvirga thermotolerans TaxID=2651334 RepID=A0A5P9JY38_9HYPH|nr:SDR family oxidoreductase [Microvirga thermotolerans]QFU17149.1 SDR family NAD(P)-dependent oxidoreductase [Microvirga thermotolerans]
MATAIVTGVGRGIGHELARVLLERGDRVVGTLRSMGAIPPALRDHAEAGRLSLVAMDVRDPASIAAAARAVDGPVDILVNNAGVIGPERQSTLDMDFDGFLDTLAVNTLGPLRVVQAFLPQLRRSASARIVTIGSRMGSLSYAKSDRIAYRASKAAANKVMQGLATDLAPEGIVAVSVHPGWVRTDMGGAGADLDVGESARGIAALIDRLSMADSGLFFDWQGERLPF